MLLMKRTLIILAFFLIAACSGKPSLNQEGEPLEQGSNAPESEVDYFVKYVSNGLTRRYDASYADVNGMVNLSNIAGETFERTVGPVKQGFVAKFSIKGDYMDPAIRIEVKKGDEPFVVKVENVGSSVIGAYASYTIE